MLHRRNQLAEWRDRRQREPVVVLVEHSRLVAQCKRQVGQGEALGFQLLLRDAAGKRHRLEADAADRVHVVDGHLQDVAKLMIVQSLHDRRHKHDLHPRLAAVLNAPHLHFEQGFAARLQVDVVGDAVELEIQGRQSGLLALLAQTPGWPQSGFRWSPPADG